VTAANLVPVDAVVLQAESAAPFASLTSPLILVRRTGWGRCWRPAPRWHAPWSSGGESDAAAGDLCTDCMRDLSGAETVIVAPPAPPLPPPGRLCRRHTFVESFNKLGVTASFATAFEVSTPVGADYITSELKYWSANTQGV